MREERKRTSGNVVLDRTALIRTANLLRQNAVHDEVPQPTCVHQVLQCVLTACSDVVSVLGIMFRRAGGVANQQVLHGNHRHRKH